MARILGGLALAVLAAALAAPAAAVMSDYDEPSAHPGDTEYAAGVQAVKQKQWKRAIEALSGVIRRRPWDDGTHSLLGFSYRKSGNYQKALLHYGKALELNPYHRGALEYLGEAYMELGCPGKAREMLARLESVCRRTASGGPEAWKEGCEEWRELSRFIASVRTAAQKRCALP